MNRVLIALTLLTAARASAGPVVIPSEARRLAVTVGVQEFDDPAWPPLKFPARDAQALADHLAASADFASTVHTGAHTARADILASLAALESASAGDTVVLYFSTHGTLARQLGGGLEQVLVLRDTDKERPLETGLLVRDLIERFEALPSERKVLILATCYSGAGKSALSDTVSRYLTTLKGDGARPLYEVSRATVILSASAWGETAREDESLGHDVYTHFLLQALEGYDPNEDGATSVTEAHDFARRQTYEFTRGSQRPTAILTVEGEDPIVLAGERSRRGNPVLVAYADHLHGLAVRVDGIDKGSLPGGVVLEPGWHEVAVGDWQQRLHLRAGDRLSLERLMTSEPSRQLAVRVGAGWLPGAELGDGMVTTGVLTLSGRLEDWPTAGVDVATVLSIGVGRDHWEINDERFAVDLLVARARLAVGTHWQLGRLKLNLDALAGGLLLHQAPDSRFYAHPRRGWAADLGAQLSARLRLSQSWSLGVWLASGVLVGDVDGWWAEAAAVAGWSF